jgi:hypothetical protein
MRRDTAPMTAGHPSEQRSGQAATDAATPKGAIMTILQRCAALTGAAYVVLANVGNALSTDAGPRPNLTQSPGQQVMVYLHWLAGSPSGQFGVTLELLAFAALMLFVGYLCTRVRAGGWLASAALTAGVVSIAVKLGSAAPLLAAYGLRDSLSPETARALIGMNNVAFGVDWLPTGLFVACAAGAALTTRTVGRVLGWGGVLSGAVTVGFTAVTGVHVEAANALPFLVCMLWILAVSVRLAIQRTPRRVLQAASDPVAVPA